MTKVVLPDLTAGYRSAQKLDEALEDIQVAFDNTLSRDGTSPNQMEAPLDMNSNRLLNLPAPEFPTDPVRLVDLQGGESVEGPVLWTSIVGKPSTFPADPIDHTGVTDFQEAVEDRVGSSIIAGTNVAVTYDDTTGKTTIAATAPPSGSVAYADITGKPATFPSDPHTHNESEITGLVTDLANKAPLSHTHAQSDVTGLAAALAAKADSSALTSGLATKSDVGHTHTSGSISDFTEAAQDAVASMVIGAGTVSVSYNDAINQLTITGAAGGGGGVPQGYTGAWENVVTTGGTATTNTTNLNNLIASLNSAGGGMIWFNTPGPYQINGSINLKSRVGIRMAPGAYFLWAGGVGGSIFTTSTSDVMVNADYQIYINEGNSFGGNTFDLHSHLYCRFEVIALGMNTSSTFFKIGADSTSGQSFPLYSLNTGLNHYQLKHMGTCGTGLHIIGLDTGGGTGQVVTNCTFHDCQFANCYSRGFRIDRWADSLSFSGYSYAGIIGANGIGYAVNEVLSPEYSVYNIKFSQLAIDTFGSVGGRYGCYWNGCKLMYIDSFFQNPTAENGQLNISACTSYIVQGQTPASDNIFIHSKGITTGL